MYSKRYPEPATMITARLRREFANKSTANGNYYPTKTHGISAFEEVLKTASLSFDHEEWNDFGGDEGRRTLTVCDCCRHPVGKAMLSWYRMPSGAYEVVAYLT